MESTACPVAMADRPEQPGSQMAILLRQIEDEYRAAQGALSGFTATTRHIYITTRMENMGHLADDLTEMIGGDKDQAMGMVLRCMKMVEAQHAS
jgi:hypothetical protein